MQDKSKVIFGNVIDNGSYKSSCKAKKKNIKKYGDDTGANYDVKIVKNTVIGESLNVSDIRVNEGQDGEEEFDHEKGIIVGNIRMGFGHYRISMAMASAAKAMGYKPYWMDLNSYPDTTCTKIIGAQNDLYSLGSRWSKMGWFNKIVWEPMNYDRFRALTYNSSDQKNAELMANVFENVPKDIPVIGTHVWPAQAALHAGMENVVNAIPDNWPMALHFAEGSVHTIQCKNAYMGYRICNGMGKVGLFSQLWGKKESPVCNPMPNDDLVYTGHYIDHELVSNIEADCDARMARKANGKPMRFLLTIGGAGAQREIFDAIIKHLMPAIKENKAALYVNVGDYGAVWDWLLEQNPELEAVSTKHFEDYGEASVFAESAITGDVEGVHAFYHNNIFEAVYITNLLMRSCDVLVTKPSELAFYPVPKLFITRVGKHEMWGAIHSAEMGDGTLECRDIPHILQMVDLFMQDGKLLTEMCEAIKVNKSVGLYDGAYKVVEIAMGLKNK